MYLCAQVRFHEQGHFTSAALAKRPADVFVYCEVKGKVKIKFALEKATKAQWGNRTIALLLP
jgi:hypothetical protein